MRLMVCRVKLNAILEINYRIAVLLLVMRARPGPAIRIRILGRPPYGFRIFCLRLLVSPLFGVNPPAPFVCASIMLAK